MYKQLYIMKEKIIEILKARAGNFFNDVWAESIADAIQRKRNI